MMKDTFSQHKALISDWVSDGKLPGVSHLVMQAGEVVDETLCGYADVESQSRLTERSLFRLASAT
jgi:CubicO group peptidase (beta-lactamase class C family)